MIAICAHCESRLAIPRLGVCQPCRNAHKALDDYWRKRRMPISMTSKAGHKWLPAIRVGQEAA